MRCGQFTSFFGRGSDNFFKRPNNPSKIVFTFSVLLSFFLLFLLSFLVVTWVGVMFSPIPLYRLSFVREQRWTETKIGAMTIIGSSTMLNVFVRNSGNLASCNPPPPVAKRVLRDLALRLMFSWGFCKLGIDIKLLIQKGLIIDFVLLNFPFFFCHWSRERRRLHGFLLRCGSV